MSYEEASAGNHLTRSVYLVGGFDGTDFLSDVWYACQQFIYLVRVYQRVIKVWRPDVTGDFWRQDYTPDAIYSYGADSSFRFANNSPSGAMQYLDVINAFHYIHISELHLQCMPSLRIAHLK